MFVRIFIGLLLCLLSVCPAAAQTAKAFPTSHIMTQAVLVYPAGYIASGQIFDSLTGIGGTVWTFKTLDQFSCLPGKTKIALQIVKADTNQLIAVSKPFVIDAAYSGYTHSQVTDWKILFPGIGWYRFEVLIDDQPMACYYFAVSFRLS